MGQIFSQSEKEKFIRYIVLQFKINNINDVLEYIEKPTEEILNMYSEYHYNFRGQIIIDNEKFYHVKKPKFDISKYCNERFEFYGLSIYNNIDTWYNIQATFDFDDGIEKFKKYVFIKEKNISIKHENLVKHYNYQLIFRVKDFELSNCQIKAKIFSDNLKNDIIEQHKVKNNFSYKYAMFIDLYNPSVKRTPDKLQPLPICNTVFFPSFYNI